MNQREKDTECFYELMTRLEERIGGKRTLNNFNGRHVLPGRGVYFFFEEGEFRKNFQDRLRVVRIGTHATKAGANSSLWGRLNQHKSDNGASVFRNHVGWALANKSRSENRWRDDHKHRKCISQYIGRMPFLWVKVQEQDGHNMRSRIERNSVALLSNYYDKATDKPSETWLGNTRRHKSGAIKKSGLWNIHYVRKRYDSKFLKDLASRIEQTPCPVEPVEESFDTPCIISAA